MRDLIERSILIDSEDDYFILELSSKEERDLAYAYLKKGEEVLFGCSEDITKEEYMNLKKEGCLVIQL